MDAFLSVCADRQSWLPIRPGRMLRVQHSTTRSNEKFTRQRRLSPCARRPHAVPRRARVSHLSSFKFVRKIPITRGKAKTDAALAHMDTAFAHGYAALAHMDAAFFFHHSTTFQAMPICNLGVLPV